MHGLLIVFYHDIDIQNAAPSAFQIFHKAGLKCDALRYYVHKRKDVLHNIMQTCNVDRDIHTAKNLIIRIMYGGISRAWCSDNNVDEDIVPDVVDALQSEIQNNSDALMYVGPTQQQTQQKQPLGFAIGLSLTRL